MNRKEAIKDLIDKGFVPKEPKLKQEVKVLFPKKELTEEVIQKRIKKAKLYGDPVVELF